MSHRLIKKMSQFAMVTPWLLLLSLYLISQWPPAEALPQITTPPDPAHIERLLAERQYGAALDLLETLAQQQPHSSESFLKMGRIYLQQHRWFLAEDAFNRAIARQPERVAGRVGLARTLFNQGRLAESERQWQLAAELDPQHEGVFTGMGLIHLQRFEFAAAEAAFREQQSHQNDPAARFYLAALLAPEDVQTARAHLAAIVSTEGEVEARTLARRDYLLAALAPFTEKTKTRQPAAVAKASGIAMAHAEMWPLAVHALQQARQQQTTPDAETLAFLGHSLAQVGRPAFDLFAAAYQADPDSGLVLYLQAHYFRQKEAYRAATARLLRAIELDPQNPALYAAMAGLNSQQRDYWGAEAWYAAAIHMATDKQPFKLLLAQFYMERGYQIAEMGLPMAEEIVAAAPDDAEAHDLLGWMQLLDGDPKAAEANLQKAVELAPEFVRARYHLARVLAVNGKISAALDEYQRVVDLDTTTGFRERALRELLRLK